MQEFMLATKAMELLKEIRGLREDAELEVRKYISLEFLSLIDNRGIYLFVSDSSQVSLYMLLVHASYRLLPQNLKHIAKVLVEHAKCRPECIKHFYQGFDQSGDSELARAVSHVCLDFLLAQDMTDEAEKMLLKADEPQIRNIMAFARKIYEQSPYLLQPALRKILRLLDL